MHVQLRPWLQFPVQALGGDFLIQYKINAIKIIQPIVKQIVKNILGTPFVFKEWYL